VNNASATWRALVIRSWPSPRGRDCCGGLGKILLGKICSESLIHSLYQEDDPSIAGKLGLRKARPPTPPFKTAPAATRLTVSSIVVKPLRIECEVEPARVRLARWL
jgi:hypothetical protein